MTESLFSDKALLSAMMQGEGDCVTALDLLKSQDLRNVRDRHVFDAIRLVMLGGDVPDPITVADKLMETKTLDSAGGVVYLAELVDFVSGGDIKPYIATIKNDAIKRRLYGVCEDVKQALDNSPDMTSTEALELAEAHLFNLAEERATKETRHIKPIMMETLEDITDRIYNDAPTGVMTGFGKLDYMTSGFKPGQLILLAARPSMGKTSFALNVAVNAALTHGIGVAIFSLEMSESELMERMISSEGLIDSRRLRTGRGVTDDDYKNMAKAASDLVDLPIFINDTASMTPLDIMSAVRRLKARNEIGLVIIDYLQLMTSGHKTTNSNHEMSRISRDLKVMARDMEVPVLALSQLSRGPESRDDRRPLLSDLRDSGSLEQDADMAMFVYRGEQYYGPFHKGEDIKGKAEMIVRKQRNGPTGTVYLDWDGPTTRFIDGS